ncbi:MAG: efflux RND transporter permease subunit [Halothiobacillaceae bacterium]
MMDRFNLSALAVRERAVTLYFILITALAGALAFVELGRAEDPVFTVKVMTVSAAWPGATALQMQEQVADPLEKRLQQVPYFDWVQTTARPGRVDMLVQFKDYTPADEVQDVFYQVRKRLGDEAQRLPDGVAGPFFNDDFSDVYFTLYALRAENYPLRLLAREAERLRDDLLRVEGVAKVDLIGERPERVFVEFSDERLATLGFSLAEVIEALQAENALLPAGSIETAGPRVYLRQDAEKLSLDRLRDLPIEIDGRLLRLSDIATVERGYRDPPEYLVRNRGEPVVMLGVVMKPGENGLALGERLEAFERTMPERSPIGLSLERVTDQERAIRLAVDEFQLKFLVALLVVMLVGFLTLGFRAGLVVALAVPLTLGATFVIMQITGRNLDRVTLGALILALGLLVDDAIIAIEMMLVKMEEGWDRMAAAAHAWTVTAGPMLAGTLVTVIGFVPIGFAASNVGEYAGNIFWILAFALLISWLVAVAFTPYLGVKLLPNIRPVAGGHEGMYQSRGYRILRAMITFFVRHRVLAVLLTVGLMALAVVGMKEKVEQQFFPGSDRPELLVDIYLPEGTSIETTRAVAKRVEATLSKMPQTRSLSTYIGAGAPRFFLALNPELPNSAFAKVIAIAEDADARERLRAQLQARVDEGAFPEARVRVHALLYGPPVVWPVTFRVMGPDPSVLREIGRSVRDRMQENHDVVDPHLEWGERVPVVRLVYDPDQLRLQGLTPLMVAEQTGLMLSGTPVTELREGTRSVPLMLRAPLADRSDLEALGNLTIRNAEGRSLPLSQVASLEIDYEDPVLKRRNRDPFINVNAEIRPGAQPPDVTMAIWPELADIRSDLPPGYRIEIGGSVEESGKAQASIRKLMPVMVLLMITVIMLAMRSFAGTVMVLLTGPLGLIGAVGALLLFKQPFGFVATLGLIGLAGILMRNTLILAGQIQENRREGMDDWNAVIEATLRRARPVVVTALTAVLAFIPLTFNTFWGPLAYVLIGGITMGTVLTLLFLPAIYALWFRVKPPAQV